jgi:hypothetical protein
MGTTADKLNYLSNTKSLIKNAIVNKGQTINSGDSFRSFASKIENISSGVDLNDYYYLNNASGALVERIKELPENLVDTGTTSLDSFFYR